MIDLLTILTLIVNWLVIMIVLFVGYKLIKKMTQKWVFEVLHEFQNDLRKEDRMESIRKMRGGEYDNM